MTAYAIVCMYDETNMSLACSIPRCVCPRAALFQAMTPKHMPNPRRNTVTITVTALNSRLHMPHGHRPSPYHDQSRGRSSALILSPHSRAEPASQRAKPTASAPRSLFLHSDLTPPSAHPRLSTNTNPRKRPSLGRAKRKRLF